MRCAASLLPVLLALLLAACQKELYYGGCGGVEVVVLSYTEPGTTQYRQDIDSLRWMLFDGGGRYLRELQMTDQRRQYFGRGELPDGDYTLVCLANATGRTPLDGRGLTLDSLTLRAGDRRPDGTYGNAEDLFWTMQRFSMGEEESTVECPLSDIHCHLHVRLWWRGVPETDGDYSLRLYGVPVACKPGIDGIAIGGLHHPLLTDTLGEHRIAVEPYNFIINGEFVTLRWTDEHMPSLQLWCGDEAVTPLIDLYEVFSEWHWSPDRTVAQDYWLDIEIRPDGTAEVSAGGRGRVVDWQDGGTIGGHT